MPLVVNIGVSRKASENYQSAGVSLNLSAELDQALLAKPNDLHAQIARLYQLADEAVVRQLNQLGQTDTQPVPTNGNGNGHHPGNGGNGSGAASRPAYSANNQNRTNPAPRNGNPPPPATASQLRDIRTIARRLNLDAERHALDTFGFSLNEASIAEASQLIDDLKAMQEQAPPARR